MSNQELHVIFGTGPLGMAVMRQLALQGRHIRLVNRSGKADVPAGVEVVKGDATNPASVRTLCQGAEVVYNCTNAPYTEWVTVFPPLQAGILEGVAAMGAKLISAENVYMYGDTNGAPLTEALSYAAKTRKGRVRAKMAEDLLNAHRSGKVRVAIGRASDFFGPGVLASAAGERVFYPALAGKKVTVLGNLDVPHTLTYIDDFAKGLVTLGEHDEALGRAWHIPSAETLTMRQWLTLLFAEAGQKPNVGTAPSLAVKALGLFNPMIREMVELLYEFEKPFTVDHSDYADAFGTATTPHRVALCRTLEWYQAHPQT